MGKRDFKPTKEQQEKFNKLTKDEQVAAVRRRMEAGDSNVDAAMALGCTPGQVAGIRQRHKIPAKKRKEAERARKSLVEKRAAQKQARIVPEKPAKRPMSAAIEPPPEPAGKPKPPYKLAVSRFTACDDKWEDGRLCDYERDEKSRFCKLHNWMRKHPRS